MNKLIILILFVTLNTYAWNPFEKKDKTSQLPLTSDEYKKILVEESWGDEYIKVKIYNPFLGSLTCDQVEFVEKDGKRYTISQNLFISPQTIRTFNVYPLNKFKVKSYRLFCKCEKLTSGTGTCLPDVR